ncbi:YbaY family lipoprotein [Neiella marina]|uniref:YbaY family lipoprotein n=1 Tax=Neiella holothuriorum TaxID=2870530 RepID=A0ABS7EB54_9GAMM|nr:YbaY family lipoprotein [Neiella holothuriorum]MBW8189567.1 YbaY family lipoprotein [Neiella holothuriorum]
MLGCRLFAVLIGVMVTIVGCQPSPPTHAELSGAWLQTQDGHQQGVVLHPDGDLSLVGIANEQGERWQYDAQSQRLILITDSTLQSETHIVEYDIQSFSQAQFTLVGDGRMAGEFARADEQLAVISGDVTYHQRMALSPRAMLTVVLNDVSLADAPAKQMASYAVALNGKQVPVPFKLALMKSQVEAGHRYSIRASIHVDDKLLFTSTRHYGVEPMQSGSVQVEVEPVQRRKPTLNERSQQTFYGELVCADCPNGPVHLGLEADNTFLMLDSAGKHASFGGWKQQGPVLTLTASDGQSYWFRRHQNGLEPLLAAGSAKLPAPPLLLDAPMPSLDLAIQLIGDYRYMADAAVFQECVTGKRWPVAQDQGGLRLEQAYMQNRAGPGEPLHMTVAGKLKVLPGMEEGSEVETLIVSELVNVADQDTTCD